LTNHFFNITQLIFPNLKLRKKLKKEEIWTFCRKYTSCLCKYYLWIL